MTQLEAQALVAYMQRARQIIPTVGAEWDLVRGAMVVVEGLATGLVVIDVKSATAKSGPQAEGSKE